MEGIRFPALPEGWDTPAHITADPATGCLHWADDRANGLPWDVARVLIANATNSSRMDLCGITQRCVHPTHGQATTRPIAGGAA